MANIEIFKTVIKYRKNICSSVKMLGSECRKGSCHVDLSLCMFFMNLSHKTVRIFKYHENRSWLGCTQCETNWRHSNDASKLTMFYNDTQNTLPLITKILTILSQRRLDLPLVPKILQRAEGQGNSVCWLLSSYVFCIFQDFWSFLFHVTVVQVTSCMALHSI